MNNLRPVNAYAMAEFRPDFRPNRGMIYQNPFETTDIFNNENVMSTPLRQWLKKTTSILLRELNLLTPEERNFDKIIEECKKEGVNTWVVNHLVNHGIAELTVIPYMDLFIPVWNRIKTSENKENLINILNENLNDSEDVCIIGIQERLIQTLSSSFEDMEFRISQREYISNLLLAQKKKYESTKGITYAECLKECISILDKFNVIGEERKTWMETFEMVKKDKIENSLNTILRDYIMNDIITYSDAYDMMMKIGQDDDILKDKTFQKFLTHLSNEHKKKFWAKIYSIVEPYSYSIAYCFGCLVTYLIVYPKIKK